MEWKKAVETDEAQTKIPKRWLLIHYYEALNLLFRFENSLRVFVYAVLKNEYKDDWLTCSFSTGDAEPKSISSIANKRLNQASNFGYLGFDIRAPLMHLTSGELVELLTSEAYWPKFRPHFKGNKEIIRNKLLEIGTIRNSLAHFRPIKQDDIELIKQNSKHTLLGVEGCLSNLFSTPLRVPTNTTDDWYKELSTLGSAQVNTTPYYSSNESWINICLVFRGTQFSKTQFGDSFFDYKMAKLNTPNMLSRYTGLRRIVTYVSESLTYPAMTDQYDIEIYKHINLIFRKDVLISNVQSIKDELSQVLRAIAEECDLLQKDGLARGALVESANVWAVFRTPEGKPGSWNFQYSALSQPYESNHPDEYWGTKESAADVVAGLPRYPWMPEDISLRESWMD